MGTERRRALRLWPLLILLGLGACSPGGGPRLDPSAPGSEVEAERMYAGILDAYQRGEIERARASSVQLLEARPDFHGAPDLRSRLADSYLREARWDLALHHLDRLLEDYPRSDERWPGIAMKARALAESGRRLDAAIGLDRALEYWPENTWRDRAEADLTDLLERGLDAPELRLFQQRRPRSVFLPLARFAEAKRYLDDGREEEGRSILTNLAADERLGPLAIRAQRLLDDLARGIGLPPGATVAALRPGLIGVLAPLTGRYAVYGEAFADGARAALGRYNRDNLSDFQLALGDTRGEPVAAALAARSLILEQGAAGLMGSVLSNPTVAAAVEANARLVPLLSPSATAENIHELGPWIFQNNITGEAQVLALARVALLELLGARFAVLYPKQGNGKVLARVFEETVEELGGEIVASLPYEVGMTDFTEALEILRDAQPEVLFLPGEVEQLLLLVPQLEYHDIGAQLLGNEAWNSRRLARLGGSRVEGAIFPSDVLLKRDRELYREFLRLYQGRYDSSVNPVAARGFLGMTMLLETLGDGASSREEIRAQLALRTADTGDHLTRRELLSEQVLLMTIRDGEIVPYGRGEFLAPSAPAPGRGASQTPWGGDD